MGRTGKFQQKPLPDGFRTGRGLWLLAALAVAAMGLAACESTSSTVKKPARAVYLEGEEFADQELWSEAVTKFQEVIDQNPGTLLGAFAYLKMADVQFAQEEWKDAETNYRLFLASNRNSHMTPYVLFRVMSVAHKTSFTGLLFPEREVDRDMEPNRGIIREYKRFFFLYPNSKFIDQAKFFFRDARISLAKHERVVADFYFGREHYNAAASRYLYLLRTYPNFHDAQDVLENLIESYRRNQQPELAMEMERLYKRRFEGAGLAAEQEPERTQTPVRTPAVPAEAAPPAPAEAPAPAKAPAPAEAPAPGEAPVPAGAPAPAPPPQ